MVRFRPSPAEAIARRHTRGLSERRFVEGSQLSRMQAVTALLEQIECGKADLQMLGDRRLVESVGRPWQLDLAMQRLVGDAKKRAVGHPQAKALGRNRAALHVDGDGAREVDALAFLREAKLPVAVVVGHHGARPEAAASRRRRHAR